ncbi:alpha-1,4-glucan lyase [Microdochium trichocladiopsis]|uniref:alpha-glucosidase n=1 Tax=Microdochium trichocladiopsis TaxID=1682393 RepID=A0A9P8Y1X9_9PEZI|nr:alpha-1,4-glucan lyase [Microdochium trichocladiopsis]KAH7025658.1 alpha-1,4-glucan lyase [Microdochium trichocladiopsis]
MGTLEQIKLRDPYIFKKADDFFSLDVDGPGSSMKQPRSISYVDNDQQLSNGQQNPVCRHGRIFRFDDNSLLLIQFLRPKVWRVRFSPKNKSPQDFTDYNTRTIIRDTTTELIRVLDRVQNIDWRVDLIQSDEYYILQSIVVHDGKDEKGLELWIQKDPFQITAVRLLTGLEPATRPPQAQDLEDSNHDGLGFPNEVSGQRRAVIWQTKPRGLLYGDQSTVLCLERSVTADYMGFGEQGGSSFFKERTFLNYFNFDNMRYFNVYGQGPLNDSEPLYHSEPYWIEVDAQPAYRTQVATFIDNYSHVCVDIGVADPSTFRVATRFNSFQGIFMAGDTVADVIQLHTSIVGKPKLKPRYVLGNHQGCYGYDTRDMVLDAVKEYRKAGIPLDGMHIDVDIQDDYRTFTINKNAGRFPDPESMFKDLRQLGVKCSTNITPYINSTPNDDYTTLNEALKAGYFIVDLRDIDPSAPNPQDQRYLQQGTAGVYFTEPDNEWKRPQYEQRDDYSFRDQFNSGKPFHGGISYGANLGHPGFYPNLNSKSVRLWWGRQYRELFECGLDFVWQDMTSPCIAEQYGDMKSLPFRLMIDSDGWSGDPNASQQKKAIEIWSLYSYNLHKATYHGLNNLHRIDKNNENDKLAWRENRRNFIIGRGSFAGSHRFAGLWTGDNASTWDFLKISVAQVLALGLSGVTIAGADVGGFEADERQLDYADPELLIRWYSAYSLLPWFRNHYTRQRDWIDRPGVQRKPGKWFQEPYAYQLHYEQHKDKYRDREAEIYRAVLPSCRYSIRLRYSLMQLLYDAMFENMLTGLPIARAMPITDELDRSLFSKDNRDCTGSQYMVRNDLLVAPQLDREAASGGVRELYLPYPDHWLPMNLRADDEIGLPLANSTPGGRRIQYECRISDDDEQIPYSTPMYIREGAIIPKIQVRDFVPDYSTAQQDPNPITIHVYPGKDNSYDMFLDDGISRDSAPKASSQTGGTLQGEWTKGLTDEKADSNYTQVAFKQVTTKQVNHSTHVVKYTRHLWARTPFNGFKGNLTQMISSEYKFVFWHLPQSDLATAEVSVTLDQAKYDVNVDRKHRATIVTVPVEDVHTTEGLHITISMVSEI